MEAYECKHHPVMPPGPIEAIKFRMEQIGTGPKDIERMIWRINRVYEILSHRRPLTLHMIRLLNKELGIPADVLIAVSAAEDERFALVA